MLLTLRQSIIPYPTIESGGGGGNNIEGGEIEEGQGAERQSALYGAQEMGDKLGLYWAKLSSNWDLAYFNLIALN